MAHVLLAVVLRGSQTRLAGSRVSSLFGGTAMATALHSGSVPSHGTRVSAYDQPAYQAFMVLYVGFIALPIIAGADKFFDLLTNWDTYLAPIVPQTLGISAHTFML